MYFSRSALCAKAASRKARKKTLRRCVKDTMCNLCSLSLGFCTSKYARFRTFTFVKRPLFLSLYIYVYIFVLTRIFTPVRPLRRLFPGEHLFLLSRRRRLVPLRGEAAAKTRLLCLPLNRRTRLFDRPDRTRAIETRMTQDLQKTCSHSRTITWCWFGWKVFKFPNITRRW